MEKLVNPTMAVTVTGPADGVTHVGDPANAALLVDGCKNIRPLLGTLVVLTVYAVVVVGMTMLPVVVVPHAAGDTLLTLHNCAMFNSPNSRRPLLLVTVVPRRMTPDPLDVRHISVFQHCAGVAPNRLISWLFPSKRNDVPPRKFMSMVPVLLRRQPNPGSAAYEYGGAAAVPTGASNGNTPAATMFPFQYAVPSESTHQFARYLFVVGLYVTENGRGRVNSPVALSGHVNSNDNWAWHGKPNSRGTDSSRANKVVRFIASPDVVL